MNVSLFTTEKLRLSNSTGSDDAALSLSLSQSEFQLFQSLQPIVTGPIKLYWNLLVRTDPPEKKDKIITIMNIIMVSLVSTCGTMTKSISGN